MKTLGLLILFVASTIVTGDEPGDDKSLRAENVTLRALLDEAVKAMEMQRVHIERLQVSKNCV